MNPLSSTRKNFAPDTHPAQAHAQVFHHVSQMSPDALQGGIESADYTVPILGALASKPNVTRKDVIKAAADAAGAGKIQPSQAVAVISEMPTDPDKLKPWLHALYAFQLTALTHMKAQALPEGPAQ